MSNTTLLLSSDFSCKKFPIYWKKGLLLSPQHCDSDCIRCMSVNINSAFDNDAKASCVPQITMKNAKICNIYCRTYKSLHNYFIFKLPITPKVEHVQDILIGMNLFSKNALCTSFVLIYSYEILLTTKN